jgi:hypothetical protein
MRRPLLYGLAFLAAAVLLAGCDDHSCPVREVRHEIVDVSLDSQNSLEFSKCVSYGDCNQLCVDTAMARSSNSSMVDACRRVDPDGGAGAGSGGVPQVSIEITYKVFAACGV